MTWYSNELHLFSICWLRLTKFKEFPLTTNLVMLTQWDLPIKWFRWLWCIIKMHETGFDWILLNLKQMSINISFSALIHFVWSERLFVDLFNLYTHFFFLPEAVNAPWQNSVAFIFSIRSESFVFCRALKKKPTCYNKGLARESNG